MPKVAMSQTTLTSTKEFRAFSFPFFFNYKKNRGAFTLPILVFNIFLYFFFLHLKQTKPDHGHTRGTGGSNEMDRQEPLDSLQPRR